MRPPREADYHSGFLYAASVATIPPRALEEVYAVPPADFTRTRNAKAAALAKAGQREAAVALRRLRRPAAILWAVNQLGRLDARRLDAFIDAVARLRPSSASTTSWTPERSGSELIATPWDSSASASRAAAPCRAPRSIHGTPTTCATAG